MITSVGGLSEEPIEFLDRLRKLDVLQPSTGVCSNPPTDDARVPSEDNTELGGFLVPSFDSDSRHKKCQREHSLIVRGSATEKSEIEPVRKGVGHMKMALSS